MTIIRVRVKDYQVLADVGINPEEANRTQPLIVNTELELVNNMVSEISETIDYRKIVAEVENLALMHIPLIENFASKLASNCLKLPGVSAVKIEVDKRFALTRGLAGVTVEMAKSV